jgi:hypothetical protein
VEELGAQNYALRKYLTELMDRLSNPVHKRLIQAYEGSDPKESMESELGEILLEVLHHED